MTAGSCVAQRLQTQAKATISGRQRVIREGGGAAASLQTTNYPHCPPAPPTGNCSQPGPLIISNDLSFSERRPPDAKSARLRRELAVPHNYRGEERPTGSVQGGPRRWTASLKCGEVCAELLRSAQSRRCYLSFLVFALFF